MSKIYNFVYITTNLINGKQYVGDHSCNNLDKDDYIGSGRPYFKNAVNEHGFKNFKREILEFFETKEEAFIAQEKYILQFNTLVPNGYNISPKGGHLFKGSMAESTKRKIGDANKISLKGKILSEETRKKVSESNKGKPAWNKGLPAWNKGKKMQALSEETKEKISAYQKGRPKSQETIDKIKLSCVGNNKGKTPWNKGKTKPKLA